jgi:hypothetical protein
MGAFLTSNGNAVHSDLVSESNNAIFDIGTMGPESDIGWPIGGIVLRIIVICHAVPPENFLTAEW